MTAPVLLLAPAVVLMVTFAGALLRSRPARRRHLYSSAAETASGANRPPVRRITATRLPNSS